MTRKGETYVLPHLTNPTTDLLLLVNSLCGNKCLALDGEAYIHGMSLQNILSRVKKYKEGLTEEVKYYLFDLVIPGMNFSDRYIILKNALALYEDTAKVFDTLICHRIHNDAEMKRWHEIYTQLGYEGSIIRHADSEYGIAKRSPDLFKYKHFMDDEAKITNVWPDNNGNAMFTVIQKNGKECKVTPKRTHEERKAIFTDPTAYIGKWITCKFQTYTDDGIMQFPVGMALRKCNDAGEPVE